MALKDIADQFSPISEEIDERSIVFDVAGNAHLIGTPADIAASILSTAVHQGISAVNIAIADNPDAAVCAARFIDGISVIAPGQEGEHLAAVPIAALQSSVYKLKNTPLWLEDEQIIETLLRWGIRSFGDFTALPEDSIAARLGNEGVRLQRFARGGIKRPLLVNRQSEPFQRSIELEYPIDLLEHFSFIVRRQIAGLCNEAESAGLAIQTLQLRLSLEDRSEYDRALRLPFPTTDDKTLFNMLSLAMSNQSFDSAIVALSLTADPIKPRRVQGGLFETATPEPEKLQLTLSRIERIIGQENVGCPAILNTHRPDAVTIMRFQVVRKSLPDRAIESVLSPEILTKASPIVGFRLYRPALEATVRTRSDTPVSINSKQSANQQTIQGNIVKAAGPWRTSGEWWEESPWCRDEWDVALSDGSVYRIFFALESQSWFIEGAYD